MKAVFFKQEEAGITEAHALIGGQDLHGLTEKLRLIFQVEKAGGQIKGRLDLSVQFVHP